MIRILLIIKGSFFVNRYRNMFRHAAFFIATVLAKLD